MSEQNWGCLDKMSEVNFSPAETLVLEKKIFKGFLPYMGVAAILGHVTQMF